ncbi:Ig-like domain repeat protein, partial [Methanobrevibacter sp. OttesenSCG-928-K11]|nr:Ig-like domain repeat protein [Methanobrevibacter sp. OttesenSCG-928-K11]
IMIGIILAVFLLSCSLSAVSAVDKTIDDTENILDGITDISDGDTLYLNPGIYDKAGDRGITINKNITIQGNGSAEDVIIDAKNLNRIFTISAGNTVNLINITFTNGKTNDYGGAIYHSGDNFQIIDCIIYNNTAGYGGAIYNDGNNFSISGTIFMDNTASIGGAIFNDGNNFSIIGDNILSYNFAWGYGGAIHNNGNNFSIIGNNILSYNKANGYYGGAIRNHGDNFTIIGNNILSYNTAPSSYAGAIYNIGNYFTIAGNNTLSYNSALYGGAIRNNGNYFTLTGNNTLSYNNATLSYGGAIINQGNNFLINGNNNLIYNNGTSGGGAISTMGENFSIIGNNNISYNKGPDGGAIRIVESNNFFISGNNNINNNNGTNGGAIYIYANNVFISGNNNINNNNATNGGAIYHHAGSNNYIVGNNNINDNSAVYGGAIFNNLGNYTINGNIMNNNYAASGNGSIIYNNDYLYVYNIISNSNNVGYSIYNHINATLFLNNNTINSNRIEKIYNNGLIISEITISYICNKTIYAFINDFINLNATIFDDMGNTIVGQNVSFRIHDIMNKNISVFTEGYYLSNNTFNESGIFILFGDYVGGNNITTLNGTIIIKKFPTNNSVNIPQEIIVGDTVIIKSILTDEDGNPMDNQTIDFFVDGKYVGSNVTDKDGKAVFEYTFDTSGDFNVSTKFNETLTYYGSNANNKTKVVKTLTNNVVILPEEIIVGDTVTIESILTDKDGKPMVNETIDFYVDGKYVGSAVTDKDGKATIEHKFDKEGKYKVTTNFNETATHYGSDAANNTKIVKIETITVIEVDGDKITVTLTDKDGNPLEGKEITISIENSHVIGVGITDKDGKVTFYYEDAYKYKITASFAGDDKYYGSSDVYNPPVNPDPVDPVNPVDENTATASIASAAVNMESTGNPIMMILLVLLSSLGLLG